MIPGSVSPGANEAGVSQISFADFKKTDLRVAKILEAEDIPGADRIWKLLVDVGTEKKQIVAGIKAFYTRDQLLGKSVIIVNNLVASTIRGVESRGMLLAAKDQTRLWLLSMDGDLPPGSIVG